MPSRKSDESQREQIREMMNSSAKKPRIMSDDVFMPTDEPTPAAEPKAAEPVPAAPVEAKVDEPESKGAGKPKPASKKRVRKIVYEEIDSDDEYDDDGYEEDGELSVVDEEDYADEPAAPLAAEPPAKKRVVQPKKRVVRRSAPKKKRVTKKDLDRLFEEQMAKQLEKLRREVRSEVQTHRTDLAINRAADFFKV